MTTPPAGGATGVQITEALRGRFEGVYINPVGVIIVPYNTTHVVVETEAVGSAELVTMRAPILQNLDGSEDLFRHVALQATMFKLGALYLFAEGNAYDLDFETRTFLNWVPPDDIPDILPIVGNTAQSQATALQPRFGGTVPYPSGSAKRRLFAEEALSQNTIVSGALETALDTNRTAIMGAAQGAWMTPTNAALGAVVFAMTQTDLWLAGWPPNATQPDVWRIPYRDILEDQTRHETGGSDYLARVGNGRWLGVRMLDPAAAEAMADVRRQPGQYQ